MKTITEILAADAGVRDRAVAYEKAIGRKAQLVQTVNGLEKQALDVTVLEHIRTLVPLVPEGLVTRSTRFLPGGTEVRYMLEQIIPQAMKDVRARESKRMLALTEAKARLQVIEEQLAEFEK